MLNYLIRRLGYGVLILIGVNLFTFVLFFTVNTPDDMARLNIGGKRVTQEQIDKWKAERGYDKPLLWNSAAAGGAAVTDTILFSKSVRMFVGDFGRADDGRDIAREIRERMGPSLAIAVPTFILGLFAAISFALLLVFFRATALDFAGVVLCVALMSISGLFYIIGGQYLVSKIWKLVPISGYAPGLDAVKFLVLPIALSLLWMAQSLTRLLWQWLAPTEEIETIDAPVAAQPPLVQSLPLSQFHLFGTAVDPASGAYADAPDTALSLTLKGTNSNHEQRLARAVIADEQQAEKVYKVGDTFANGVRVEAIYPDRVVLNAAGRIEVLRLRQLQGGALRSGNGSAPLPSVATPGSSGLVGLNEMPTSAPGSVNPMVAAAPIDWEAVRQQAIADPGSIAKAFSVLPVMIDGKLAGVRVSSNTYGEQLSQAGLKPEDIVTAVNGRKLDSIESGYAALESLKTAGSVTLTVSRDGAEKTLPAIRMPR